MRMRKPPLLTGETVVRHRVVAALVEVASIINLAISGIQTAITGAQATSEAVGARNASGDIHHRQRMAA